jgi:hypothetical protein
MAFAHRLAVVAGTICVLSQSTSRDAAAARLPNPCTLLTSAEISSVVGGTFGASSPIGPTGCSWMAKGVTVTLVTQDASLWAQATAPLAGITRLPVSGIGDAGMYTIAGQFASLGVRKGAVTIIVRMYGVHPLDKQEALEKSLAAVVLPKL